MVSRGNCWLSVNGIPDPIPLKGGDCFLLALGSGTHEHRKVRFGREYTSA